VSVSEDDGVDALEVTVGASLDGVRADRALALLADLSRSAALALIDSGAVLIDGVVLARGSRPLRAGEHLVAALPPADTGVVAPDLSVSINVVVEDDDFLILNKAPGDVVHPGAGRRDGTLIAGVLARYPEIAELGDDDPIRPGVVHRLDKGTSGLVAIARSPRGLASLRAQMLAREVTRTYVGLVEGTVLDDRGVIDAPIGRSLRHPTAMAVRADGRPARTHYRVRRRFTRPRATTLLELDLETGRTHQIRVHASSIGHPIVNDTRYGHRREERLAPERLFLHAATLVFAHPATGDAVTATAALPEDLVVVLGESS
jgi:23S rRNA pseudouridine1911/1915/1917 synthase